MNRYSLKINSLSCFIFLLIRFRFFQSLSTLDFAVHKIAVAVLEHGRSRILLGKQMLRDLAPLYTDIRIIEANSAVTFLAVQVIDLIAELDVIRQRHDQSPAE